MSSIQNSPVTTTTRWDEIFHQVTRYQESASDFFVNFPTDVTMDDESAMLKIRGNSCNLTCWSASQLFSMLKMPAKYFKELLYHGQGELVAQHVNHHLKKQFKDSDRNVLIRLRENGDPLVRAFLSEKYSVWDNNHLLEALILAYEDLDTFEIRQSYLDGDKLHLRFIFPNTEIDLSSNGEEDLLESGIYVINSEVGSSSVRVMPFSYRQVCSNGLIMPVSLANFQQRHRGLDSKDMKDWVISALMESQELAGHLNDTLKKATKLPVEDPLELIKREAKSHSISGQMAEKILKIFDLEPYPTVAGVVNAFTRTAQEFDVDNQLYLEETAGKILYQYANV